jgi:hypothetical protein
MADGAADGEAVGMAIMSTHGRPIARRGPRVHARIGEVWDERRAFLTLRPIRCRLCRNRIEAGETVVRTPGDLGYAGGCCVSLHVRGQGSCPLCDRVRMTGRKCRACGGSGFGEIA